MDLCPDAPAAPGGLATPASRCTSNSIAPIADEAATGKRYSCECGGDDASTQWVCKQQPGTSWDILLLPSNGTFSWEAKTARINIIERAGTPAQTLGNCTDPADCTSPERYRYAYPGVWDGAFSGCSWTQGACISPLVGDDCLVFTCKSPNISCPASYARKCPGWSPMGCGKPPHETRPYWSHHCVPGQSTFKTSACKGHPPVRALACTGAAQPAACLGGQQAAAARSC